MLNIGEDGICLDIDKEMMEFALAVNAKIYFDGLWYSGINKIGYFMNKIKYCCIQIRQFLKYNCDIYNNEYECPDIVFIFAKV